MATRPASARPLGPRLRSWSWVVALYGGLLVLAELLFYGLFRVGLFSHFALWGPPLRLLPVWLVTGWLSSRHVRKGEVSCSIRKRAAEGAEPAPWRRGFGVLAPGRFTFSFGVPRSSIVVPAGPDQVIPVDRVDVPGWESRRGIGWVFRPVAVQLSGSEGVYEVRVAADDVRRVRAELENRPVTQEPA